ncbi:MAG: type VI secretion system baseplate subunit TssG [Neisseriaceae bacterium]|nr:type VI secretion system baseplate subunit TssG [Neisseriaceae bacterium]MBP6863540.1 type VI secretion system baseplate subunit TssG [Neisseriaceae bacterium]
MNRIDDLIQRPEGHQFHQFCRLLAAALPAGQRLGEGESIAADGVQFCSWPLLGFPSSELKRSTREYHYHYIHPVVFTTFMGFVGTDGVMPNWLIATAAQKNAGTEHLNAFFDVFHHRIVTQYYRIWQKYRLAAQYEVSAEDALSQALLALLGRQAPDREALAPNNWLGIMTVLNQSNKNAAGIQNIVRYVLDEVVAVKVEECYPMQMPLQPQSLKAGLKFGQSVLGRFFYDGNTHIMITVTAGEGFALQHLYQGQPLRQLLARLVGAYVGHKWVALLTIKMLHGQLPVASLATGKAGLGMGLRLPGEVATEFVQINLGVLND